MKNWTTRFSEHGSALLLSLWALLILSGMLFVWIKFINQRITITREANFGFQARALAHSGAMVALNPSVSENTPLLQQSFDADHSYQATVSNEGGRINLIWMLWGNNATDKPESHPERITFVKNYLVLVRHLTLQQADVIADSLMDWMDADDTPRQNGAEKSANYQPTNLPLQSLDEIKQVRGADVLVSQPGWSDDFTLWSGGKIDLQHAPIQVVASLPGITEQQAQVFVQTRDGKDGVNGTLDDIIFKTDAQAAQYLGISNDPIKAKEIALLAGVTNDPTFRILSVGHAGNRDRRLEVVARRNSGQAPTIKLWQEY